MRERAGSRGDRRGPRQPDRVVAAPASSDLPIRVGVIDDHPTIELAVRAAAAATGSISVVASARTREAGRELLGRADLEVVLVDVQLAGSAEGLRLLRERDAGGAPAIVLTAYDYPALVRAAFDHGAAGYVLKSDEIATILDAITAVARGGTAFSATRLRAMRQAPRQPSPRELEVLRHVSHGATNDEIATRLSLSLKTVESHLRRLFARYGVMSRTELAVMALEEGWLDLASASEAP